MPSVTTNSHVTTTRLKPDELVLIGGPCLPTDVSVVDDGGACRFSPARMPPGGQCKIRPGNFVNLKMRRRVDQKPHEIEINPDSTPPLSGGVPKPSLEVPGG